MDFGIVLLQNRLGDALEVLVLPIQLEVAGHGVHEAFLTLEHLKRTGDAATGEECGPRDSPADVSEGEAFPVRQRASAGDAERVECGARDRDRVRGAGGVEPERSRAAGGNRVRALRDVVEARVAHWRHVAQPALHLVGQGERGEEVATRRAGIFRGGEHGPEVVARVTGLALREVAVVEVEVAHERRVVEGRPIWCGVAATDQRARAGAIEFLHLSAHQLNGLALEGANRARQGVKHANFELLARRLRQIIVGRSDRILSQPLGDRHGTEVRYHLTSDR